MSVNRETTEDLMRAKVPPTDPRWLLLCNFPLCKNILRTNEHLVCDEHPGRLAATVAAGYAEMKPQEGRYCGRCQEHHSSGERCPYSGEVVT